jgi:hypothetical protein
MGSSVWKWFGVKTVYRTRTKGRPRHRDATYDPTATVVEERVLLFRARSFGEAIRKAEREARDYARFRYRNAYGQTVITRYIGSCNAFWAFCDAPVAGAEVFSRVEEFPKSVRDAQIGNRLTAQKRVNRMFLSAARPHGRPRTPSHGR